MLAKRIERIVIVLLLLSPLVSLSQVTTSTYSGVVRNANNEPLVGATITATHNPTGTVYRVASRAGGRFDLYNMNPGGPYTIVATYVGFADEKRDDIHLNLGENVAEDITLKERTSTLTEVVVSTTRSATGNSRGGAQSNIGRDKMTNIPSVGRNLNDFIKYTPQVKITANGGFSIAGQNNRYNSFMIDGAVNNDVFGVSETGTNGGRTSAPPISIDAIDQIAVQISPFDASLGNFTGGGINAITRSGTNTLTGSAYYIFRNEKLAGRAPVPQPKPGQPGITERPKLSDFSNKTFGIRVGGPIIQNKMFFFLNVERQDDSRPQPFDPSTFRGNYIQNDSLNVLINHLNSKYSYALGDYISNPDLIEATRVTTKIDWNVNQSHQLSLSYRLNKANRTNPSRSSASSINFVSGAEYFPSTTHSGTGELNSKFGNRMNNKIRVALTRVVDDRAVVGTPFPNVQIRDANGTNIFFGSEISSTANLLKTSIVNIYDAFRYVAGAHSLSAGTDIDLVKTYNLFINRNFGFYEYATIGAFINDARPLRYRRGYSLVDNGKSGDESENAAAVFNSMRIGFFINDDIKLGTNLSLTLGLRADRNSFQDNPAVDQFFRDTGAAIVSQYYDLKGAGTGKLFKPNWLFSPRLGFTYRLPDENATVRGGIGLFSGRIPLVWPGGGFQNTGVTVGAIDVNNPNITFRDNINNQYTATDLGASRITPQGELNLVARNFKLPQVLRTSLAVDKRLGQGWTFTIEGIFTKNIHEVAWENLIFLPSAKVELAAPETRTVYDPLLIAQSSSTRNAIKIPFRPYLPLSDIGRSPYTSIILVKNSEGRKGYSYSATFTVDKAFRRGFAFNANYTYGNSIVNNEATSSINSSNWNNMEAVNGRNALTLSRSDFDLGHRINAYVSKKFSYAKHFGTTITLVYTGQSGSPFSYTMTQNINGDNVTFNDLMFVPTRAQVDQMVFVNNTSNGVTYTPTQQREFLNNYIDSDKYLRKRRGQFAERNGARLPFTHVIDLAIKQDFNLKLGAKTYQLQLTYEVANFTNMLNSEWGRQYFVSFDQLNPLQFAGFTTGTRTPTYRFSPQTGPGGKPITVSDGITPFNSSRWTSQLGVRVNF